MELEIELDTKGAAVRGVDLTALKNDIQSELDKIALSAGTSPPKAKETLPPAGAQGDAAIIHWLIHLAGEPAMLRVYAKAAVFGINELVRAARRGAGAGDDDGKETDLLLVRVKGLVVDLVLPASEAVIKAILDDKR